MLLAPQKREMNQGFARNRSEAAGRAGQARGEQGTHPTLREGMGLPGHMDPFLPLRSLASYAGLSVRTLRQYLELPPDQALPCYRVGGKILVRRSEFDTWVAQYRSRGRPGLARALRELGLDRKDA